MVIISDGLSGGESSSVILHLQSLIINIQTGGYFGFYWWSDEVQMLLNMTILTNITDESHSPDISAGKNTKPSARSENFPKIYFSFYQSETGKTLTDPKM